MKFYFEPNHTVIQRMKQKITGKITQHVVCKFDEKGECKTDDPKIQYILQKKLIGCTWDAEEPMIKQEEVKEILDDTEIRQLAKAKGISHWHNKNIDRLKKELEE